MASRKEQKEQLRREREEREAAEQSARRRKRLIGYGVGAAAVLVVVVVAVVLLAGGLLIGGGSSGGSGKVLPDGGSLPEAKGKNLKAAVSDAGCKTTDYKGKSREHLADLSKQVRYGSSPPTEGDHYQEAAEDGAYDQAPDVKQVVHGLEHGRIVIWFKKNLPEDGRAGLKALFDEDSYQMILTPDPTGMKSQVAASAWTREPTPNGTGHLLACPRFDDGVYDALRAFKDEYRGNGPEAVP